MKYNNLNQFCDTEKIGHFFPKKKGENTNLTISGNVVRLWSVFATIMWQLCDLEN
jgi:hypothetical protein